MMMGVNIATHPARRRGRMQTSDNVSNSIVSSHPHPPWSLLVLGSLIRLPIMSQPLAASSCLVSPPLPPSLLWGRDAQPQRPWSSDRPFDLQRNQRPAPSVGELAARLGGHVTLLQNDRAGRERNES